LVDVVANIAVKVTEAKARIFFPASYGLNIVCGCRQFDEKIIQAQNVCESRRHRYDDISGASVLSSMFFALSVDGRQDLPSIVF
jgi:hypothetical protein